MTVENDSRQINKSVYDSRVSRTGRIHELAEPFEVSLYPIYQLDEATLPPEDRIVRKVENAFAQAYDDLQWRTRGMRFVAESDTIVLDEWLRGTSVYARVLDIGVGTGRTALPLARALNEKGIVYAMDTAYNYIAILRRKAAALRISPKSIKLGVFDIQGIDDEMFYKFLDEQSLDKTLLWFGPLGLMTHDPHRVLKRCFDLLQHGGELLITQNSRYGLSYTTVEESSASGDHEFPLGYKPSIFTRRTFEDNIPTGMVLGDGKILPAHFYDSHELITLLEDVGFIVSDLRGISYLTGLYPADEYDKEAIRAFIQTVSEIAPYVAREMRKHEANPEKVWSIAASMDNTFLSSPQTTDSVRQCTYIAYRAVKSKN